MHELFYRDVYAKEFKATVISSKEGKKGFETVLSDTAFYPEGGGQPADHGMLGDAKVLDVKRRDGVIIHYTDKALPEGSEVLGVIDWKRRFDHMQQHSGEHILSGIVHRKFGYDNVGFHMDDEKVTVDFNGPLSQEDADKIEEEANEYLWTDASVRIFFPSSEELSEIDYRSKIELTGEVRLVEFPGADLCACCGTHVTHTGEIGIIKIVSIARHKGGVRIEMLCGGRAYRDYAKKHAINASISALLSAKPYETDKAVIREKEEKAALEQKISEMNEHYFAMRSENIPEGTKKVFFHEKEMTPFEIRKFCDFLMKSGKVTDAMVVSDKGEGAYNYVMGSTENDMRALGKELNKKLNGRGGGKPEMVQGSFNASLAAIKAAFIGD